MNKWEFKNGRTRCSGCGKECTKNNDGSNARTAYCPHCGSRMKNGGYDGNKEV